MVDAALDLKFRNDLDHCILIKAQAQDGVLTVGTYGARPQFIYELVSRVEQELPLPTVYRTSATLSPGQQVVEKPGARGLVVPVWKIQEDAEWWNWAVPPVWWIWSTLSGPSAGDCCTPSDQLIVIVSLLGL